MSSDKISGTGIREDIGRIIQSHKWGDNKNIGVSFTVSRSMADDIVKHILSMPTIKSEIKIHSTANSVQVGGSHYRTAIQHWDYVLANDLDYFQAQITKYVTRWKKKNGLQDLKKAQHFLEKYIEAMSSGGHDDSESTGPGAGYVNQDR